MEAIRIDLKNCHGISKLKTDEISFKNKKLCLIYASNGTMKTSFAKTFKNLCEKEKEKLKEKLQNQITHKTPEYKIQIRKSNSNSDKMELVKTQEDFAKNFFVIESMKEEYSFNQVSKLLVNDELKERYDNIYKKIRILKKGLITKINKNSGIKTDKIERSICEDFNSKTFLECLLNLENEVEEDQYLELSEIKYNDLFNKHTKTVFNDPDLLNKLKSFSEDYNKLIEQTPFFKGKFTHNASDRLSKDLEKNDFFENKHEIMLTSKESSAKNKTIKSSEEITNLINNMKDKLLEEEPLKSKFNEINKKLDKNQSTRKFRDVIKDNLKLSGEFEDEENRNYLKQKIWKSYLSKNMDDFAGLNEAYKHGKEEIEKIIEESKKDQENWTKIMDIFNDRFNFPFELTIENQSDIILKEVNTPMVKFLPKEGEEKSENEIQDFLSSGEKRALYLLKILFNLKVQENEFNNSPSDSSRKLLIFDDIADSFDYQNKYAIIEYLKEISEKDAFNMMILTHNFDFFRTVKQAIPSKTYIAYKDSKSEEINLKKCHIEENLFKFWRNNINKDKNVFLASIPFVRNLLELIDLKKEFTTLTKLLHFEEKETPKITMKDIKSIYKKVNISLKYKDEELIYDCLKKQSQQILNKNSWGLKDKIIISIVIRLRTEEFIIKKIGSEIENKTNKTRELIKKYENESKTDLTEENIRIFKRVGLITPEYIHLNSFMYEPLIDIDESCLKELYHNLDNIS